MRGRFYRLIRDLHLYLGLFISPFVLVFAISVFFLVHTLRPRIASETSTTRIVSGLPLPENLQMLSGRPLIDALKPILEKAEVPGEVGFVRHMVKEEQLIIPVTIPGRETTVSISIASRKALSSRKSILNITNIVRTVMVGRQGRKAPCGASEPPRWVALLSCRKNRPKP